ncbi:MAG: DUF2089 domain-containing protein [Chloroflexota bacterium]
MPGRHAPKTCPVCGGQLLVTRLSCDACETELTGRFAPSEFGALNPAEMSILRVFLSSRGNMKEVERHLGVSYPTARARFDGILAKLGMDQPPDPRLGLLQGLAQGDVNVEEALRRLGSRGGASDTASSRSGFDFFDAPRSAEVPERPSAAETPAFPAAPNPPPLPDPPAAL